MKRVVKHLGILSALLAYGCTSGSETTKSEVKPAAASGDATVGSITATVDGLTLEAIPQIEMDEDSSKTIPLKIATSTVGSIRIELMDFPAHGDVQIDESSTTVKYSPDKDFNGRDSFAVRVLDGSSASISRSISVKVIPVDDAPVCLSQTFGAKTAQQVGSTIECQDVDSSPLDISIKTPSTKGAVTLKGTNFTYTLAQGQTEDDQFEVIARAEAKESAPAVIKISPSLVGEKPVASSSNITCNEDSPCSGQLQAAVSRPELGIFYQITQAPAKVAAKLDIATGKVTITSPENFFGPDELKFKVRAGDQWSDEASIKITISPVNDRPVIRLGTGASATATVEEDQVMIFPIQISDVESSTQDLAVSLVSSALPKNGKVVVDQTGTRFSYSPNLNFNGVDTFQIQVCEKNSNPLFCSVPLVINITIKPVNDAPYAKPIPLAITEDSGVAVCADLAVFAGDVDNDVSQLAFKLVVDSAMKLDGNKFCFTPEANFSGEKLYSYSVKDPLGLEASATIKVTVAGTEDPTVFDDKSLTCEVVEETATVCKVNAYDADGKVSYQFTGKLISDWILDTTEFGSTGSFKIMPPKNFYGEQTLNVFAGGAGESTATAEMVIKVINVYDAPIWTSSQSERTIVSSFGSPITVTYKAESPDKLKINYTGISFDPADACGDVKTTEESDGKMNFTFQCKSGLTHVSYKVGANDGTDVGNISQSGAIELDGLTPYAIGPYWTNVNGAWHETSSDKGLGNGATSCIKFNKPLNANTLTFDYDINLSYSWIVILRDDTYNYQDYWGGYQAITLGSVKTDVSYNKRIAICHWTYDYYGGTVVNRRPEIIIKSIKFQ